MSRDFGLTSRTDHHRLTYAAVDVGTSVAVRGAILLLPAVLPVVTAAGRVSRARAALAGRFALRTSAAAA